MPVCLTSSTEDISLRIFMSSMFKSQSLLGEDENKDSGGEDGEQKGVSTTCLEIGPPPQ